MRDEVEILGSPFIISIGKIIADTLNNSKYFEDINFIPHYSNSNNGFLKEYYNNFTSKKYSLENAPSTKDILEFANKLFEHINYSHKTEELLEKISKGISEPKKKLILSYRYKFEEIINSIIPN